MDGDRVTIGQIGCGYWGPNVLRNFSALPKCRMKWVAETSTDRRTYVEANFPNITTTARYQDILDDPQVDAVLIATPAATHVELTSAALAAGKHVFVEKPLALTTPDADRIVAEAKQQNRVLMVGHTFLYNPAVRYMKQLVDSGELGDIYYLYSHRLNLGQVRNDVNAWWNLAPHDVSILLYLMNGELPTQVSANGVDYLQDGVEDVVFATLTWANRVVANIHVSWLDPNKVRRLTIVGSRKMVTYDDVADNKITIYDKGFDRTPRIGERMDYDQPLHMLQVRSGDILLPRISGAEPLRIEAVHFIECICDGKEPLSGGQIARDVVAVMEQCQAALDRERTCRSR